ncbi:MAG TPA: CoA-binding protein [Kofleriaceae bacterium]
MNPTDEQLKTILTEAKTIAMVGASENPEKPSHRIFKELLAAGYHVIPVNPRETSVLGEKAVASLAEIKEPVDIVDVFRRAEETPPIADEAAALGAKTLWLQAGISNDETAARARAHGMTIVMDKCIGATHRTLIGHE